MLQTNNTGVCSQCLSHTGPAPADRVCALPAHTAQALGCSAGNHPRPALGCLHLPSLSCSTGGVCHALLQGIFPTQGSNPGLPHCRQILQGPSRPSGRNRGLPLRRHRGQGPHLAKRWEPPPSSRDEGLLFLHGLERNPESSIQTPQEA